jgi:PAS domain S-box-containing protein
MRLNFPSFRYFLTIAAITLACFVSARFSLTLLDLGVQASPLWAPAGIGLAALLLYGRKAWVGVALGTFLVALSLNVSWGVGLGAGVGSTLGAIAAQELLRRVHVRSSLRSLGDVLLFIALAVLLSPVVNATSSTLNGYVWDLIPEGQLHINWWTVWLGDGIGILVLTPLLLTWLSRPLPPFLGVRSCQSFQAFLRAAWEQGVRWRWRVLEAAVWAALLLGISWKVFLCTPATATAHYPLEYLPFPLIVWAALRLGQRGTVLGSLMVSSIAIWGAVHRAGPFVAKTDGNMLQAVILLQTFVGVITMTALVLAAATAERRESEEQFRRMVEGAAIGIGLDNLQGQIIASNPALQSMLGYSQEELNRMCFSQFTHPDDLALDLELFAQMIAGELDSYQMEKRHIRKDGQVIWVRLINSLVRDDAGMPQFTIGMVENITKLKQAEQSIQLYADAVKNMQLGLIVWQLQDLDDLTSFRLVEMNPAARQILQVEENREAMIGKPLQEVFPNLLETAFPGIYASVVRSGRVRDLGEVRYGDTIIPEGVYATKAFPLPNQCIGLVFEDITERKQAEEALMHSEARFRVVAETAACAIMVYQGEYLRYVNPATERITEYSHNELLSIPFWQLAHPEFRDLVQQRGLARQRGEAVPQRYEIKILTKTGKERWVDFTGGTIAYEGRPAAIATAYDITDRKNAEVQLRFAAERERLLAEVALRIRQSLNIEEILNTTVAEIRCFLQADRVFIAHLGDTGHCRTVAESVEPGWSSIIGWEVNGSSVQDIRRLFQSDRVRVIHDTQQVEKTPFLEEYYRRAQVRAGMGIPLHLNGQMFGVLIANQCSAPRQWQPFEVELLQQLATQVEIAIQQGQLYQQVQSFAERLECQVEERTAELKQRMQELQDLNQVKDILLHAVSHDLKTPVQGTLMVLNNLRNKGQEKVSLSRTMLDRMILSSDQQLNLINSLLENHADTPTPLSLSREPLHLADLAETTLNSLQPLLSQNQVQLHNLIPIDLPTVSADAQKLRQVFTHLLTNATRHNPPGIQLTLSASILSPEKLPAVHPTPHTPHPFLYCTIEDSGIGMSQQQCDRLFQLYVRGIDNPHRTGIGLGLHTCRQIITAHGGAIGVTSQPGAGSRFWFTLPLQD